MKRITLSKQEINQLPASSILFASCHQTCDDLYIWSFEKYKTLDNDELKDNKQAILDDGYKGHYPQNKTEIDNYFIYHFCKNGTTGNDTSVVIFQNGEFLEVFLQENE